MLRDHFVPDIRSSGCRRQIGKVASRIPPGRSMVVTVLTISVTFPGLSERSKERSLMSVFTLDKDHPLIKAGLRSIHIVQRVELGLKPGDVVFEFPYGRIVDTGMACRRERIIPPGVDIMTIHKEAIAARASRNVVGQEVEHSKVLQFRRVV
jgi:hypothetical protein